MNEGQLLPIIGVVGGIAVTAIGYFLRDIHRTVRDQGEDIVDLKISNASLEARQQEMVRRLGDFHKAQGALVDEVHRLPERIVEMLKR